MGRKTRQREGGGGRAGQEIYKNKIQRERAEGGGGQEIYIKTRYRERGRKGGGRRYIKTKTSTSQVSDH